MADSPRLYAATRKGLFTITRSPRGRWAIDSVAFLGENMPMVLPPSPNSPTIWAAISHGHFGAKMHRSDDAGKTWKEVAVPAYPELAPGEQLITDEMGRTIPNKLELIWSLERGSSASDNKTLWCGTVPGGLFRSDDAGESWQLNQTLWNLPNRKQWMGGGADYPGIHSVAVHPQNPRNVFVAVSSGGVWMTSDQGKSWECRTAGMRCAYVPPDQAGNPNFQDPHRLVLCPTAPDHMWVQHHNGIFRTTDAGRQWTEIQNAKPSFFGFGVVVHPRQPDTAWFVPGMSDQQRTTIKAKVVVSRTRDGGKTFEVLTKGLPQRHAYDLVYRHALDNDVTGEVIAFGSTTGSLWVSDDQGDSWQTVGEHLPPVYCVRFEK